MAARNLGLLRQAVLDLGFGSDLATPINNALATEWRNLCGKRQWKWLEAGVVMPITAGSNQILIPNINAQVAPQSLRNIQSVRLWDTALQTYFPLDYKPTQQWLEINQENPPNAGMPGPPQYWTLWTEVIELWPVADMNYSAQVSLITTANTLVADGDVPLGLPQDYDDYLVWRTAMRFWARQNNWIEYGNAQQQASELLSAMQTQDEMVQRQNPDEMETTGVWGFLNRGRPNGLMSW